MVIPVTYLGTLTREFENSRERDTMWMMGR